MSRIFSGIQPSGELHIGNYLGAVKNWVRLQHEFEAIYSIVDYHAITVAYDPEQLRVRRHAMAVSLLAAGIDPNVATLFVQSQVPEHTELTWLLNTITPLGELERQTQCKEKAQRRDCSTIPCCRRRTSCCIGRTRCPSARTRCSISSCRAWWRGAGMRSSGV